jgi:hypothetical protein
MTTVRERLGEKTEIKILTPEQEADYWLNADLGSKGKANTITNTTTTKPTTSSASGAKQKFREKSQHSELKQNLRKNDNETKPKINNNNVNNNQQNSSTSDSLKSTKINSDSKNKMETDRSTVKRKLPPGAPSSNSIVVTTDEPKSKKPKR